MAQKSPLLRPFYPAAMLLALAGMACAQTLPATAPAAPPGAAPGRVGPAAVEGLPILSVEVKGNERTPTQLILDQVRSQPGQPYSLALVDVDNKSIAALDRFVSVKAEFEPVAGDQGPLPRPLRGVIVRFIVEERPLIVSVQIAGNRAFPDAEIRAGLAARPGVAIDPFRIETDRRYILDLYRKKGYAQVSVDVDRDLLNKQGLLRYQIIEGPASRISKIVIEGNTAVSTAVIKWNLQTKSYFWIFQKGTLDEDLLQIDVARIRDMYLARGYLDARVSSVLEFSEDKSAVTVRFVVLEGLRYQIGKMTLKGNTIFPEAELLGDTTRFGPGSFVERDKLEALQRRIEDAYGHEGYIYRQVEITRAFTESPGVVDVTINITEGKPYTVGAVIVRGNPATQDRVIRRQIRIYPDQTFDIVLVRKSIDRLKATGLFKDVKISPITPPNNAAGVRDALVDVAEGNTGQWGFGAGISTNVGLVGQLSLEQKNFDIANPPRSFDEFIRGQSFKGAGQFFRILLEPGTEFQRYRLTFAEPYLFDSPYSFANDLYFFTRSRESWSERRIGDIVTFGRRFGDVWAASLAFRAEQVTLSNMADLFDDGITQTEFPMAGPDGGIIRFNDTAQKILNERGSHYLSSVKLALSRDTTNSSFFPTTGSRASLSLEQYGVFGGEVGITKIEAAFNWYTTLYTDLFDRKTVLAVRNDVGFIVGGHAPTFERYYLGGMGNLRGFRFRGVGPHDGPREDPLGGSFSWNTTAEVNFPIYEDIIRGVVFVDVGTVESDVSLSSIRSDAGAGLRVALPFLNGLPIAVDFAYPISKKSGDRTQLISVALGIPF
jgi:outer membrane protein insertion porin family